MLKEKTTPKRLIIEDQTFKFLRTRVYDPVSIYSSRDAFLRIGKHDLIRKELQIHRQLLAHGFPIPEVLREGEIDGQYFYIEKSVGTSLLTYLFSEDYKKYGNISNRNFSTFLSLTRQFAEAQLSTATTKKHDKDFYC